MVTSTFFNNFGRSSEQELLEDLVVESIRIYGQDMYYLPRRLNNFDGVYFEDSISSFDTAYIIETYVKSTDSFLGQGQFLSKFGLEIRDQSVMSFARRTFANEITRYEDQILRPREGDLIYFPLNRKCFEIKFVDNKPFFYQLGELQMFDMTVELYEYSNERFSTGIVEIDSLQVNHTIDQFDYSILSQEGNMIVAKNGETLVAQHEIINENINDPGRDNERIDVEIEKNSIIDWTEENPFAEGQY